MFDMTQDIKCDLIPGADQRRLYERAALVGRRPAAHQERHRECYCVVSSQYPGKTYENTGLKKAIAFRLILMIAEPVAIFEALKTVGGVGPEGTGLTSLATNPTPEIG